MLAKDMLPKTLNELLPQNKRKQKQKDNDCYDLEFSTETFITKTSRKSSRYLKRHLLKKGIPRKTNNCILQKDVHQKLHC